MTHIRQTKDQLSTGNNLFNTVAQSFGALESLWQSGTLSKPKLSAKLKNAVALRVAQLNGYQNCVQTTATSEGTGATCSLSSDPKEQAILDLVTKLITNRGYHAESEVEAARQLGVGDLEIIRVVKMVSPASIL